MLAAPAAQAQDAKAGEKKVAMCIGCHGIPGYQASFPEIHKVPMIAGQNAKYIVALARAAYKKGDRKHPTMRSIAASLSDQDMADVAAFYEAAAKADAAEAPATCRRPSPRWRRTAEEGQLHFRAMAPTSASRSTRATPSSPASMPTTSMSR